MCARRSVCSEKFEERGQDMALDYGVVGVGTGFGALLVGPMISRKAGDAVNEVSFFVRPFSLIGEARG